MRFLPAHLAIAGLLIASLLIAPLQAQQSNPSGDSKEKEPRSKPVAESSASQQAKAEKSPQAEKQSQQQAGKAKPMTLEVVRLKKVDAASMLHVMQTAGFTQGQYRTAYRTTPPAAGQSQQQTLYVAIDDQSRTLFLRGDREMVDQALKLVKYIDQDKPSKRFELDSLSLIPVDSKHIQALSNVSQQLGLNSQVLRCGDTSFVVFRKGAGDDRQEAREQQAEHLSRVIESLTGQSDEGSQAKTDEASDGEEEKSTEPKPTDEGESEKGASQESQQASPSDSK